MTTRERFKAVMSFEKPDRLPMIEWATWWDKTLEYWRKCGLPHNLKTGIDIMEYLGLDIHAQFWIPNIKDTAPIPTHHGAGILEDLTLECYEALSPHLFLENWVDHSREAIEFRASRQQTVGDLVWVTLEGFFWFPRKLMGIEKHLYAFYDAPEVMHAINEDLLGYNLRMLDKFCGICIPDFITIAEDMSYNHGPMISKELFDEFMAPYYRKLVSAINNRGVLHNFDAGDILHQRLCKNRDIEVIVDTDGEISQLVPWFESVGITAFLPLERMSGVDAIALRKAHPGLRMVGGFDKTVMHLGEEAMRAEFERLLPVIQEGGFIPSVDHQTPPNVSLEDYRLYLSLLKEYCAL